MKTLITLAIILIGGYFVVDTVVRDNRPENIASRQRLTDQGVVDDIREICVKGVKYYYTQGAHNSRMAPAINKATLAFERCE